MHVPSPGARPQRLSLGSQAPLTHTRVATAALQTPPGSSSPLATFGAHVAGVVSVLHQRPPLQSASPPQLVPQDPATVLQKGAALPHARLLALPKFPLQPRQVCVLNSHRGAFAPQLVSDVQPTQRFVATSQVGVAPPQVALLLHSPHWPAAAPLPTQTPLRHWVSVAHTPSPGPNPHRLSTVEHAPLLQARAPKATLQVPPGTA